LIRWFFYFQFGSEGIAPSQQRNLFYWCGNSFAVQQARRLPWFQVAAVIARKLVYKIVPEGYGAKFLHGRLISRCFFTAWGFEKVCNPE
jgi:hypothetical protein